MGLLSASALVTASMIGAGVYTTSGFTLADLGSAHWTLVAWALGGLIALCGAICYGALARQFTESGGEYIFLARAVHPAAGMVAGWVSLLAGFTGAMAFAASTFELYLRGWQVTWIAAAPEHTFSIALVVIAAAVHSLGFSRGTHFQNAIVLLKLILISLFLLAALSIVSDWTGAKAVTDSATVSQAQESGAKLSGWAFALVFANALTWISLSYSGFNAAVYLTDEIENPTRNVPLAMFWGTLFVTVLYLLLNFVFVFAPPVDQVLAQSDIATVAAKWIGFLWQVRGYEAGAWLEDWVRLAILVGLATSVLALAQTGPRVYAKMATDGFLPRMFFASSATTPQQVAIPVRGIWIQAVLASIVVVFSSLRGQLDYLGFTLSVCAAASGSLVFFFRKNSIFPVHVPGYPVVPLVYVGGTLIIATLTAVRVPVQALIGLLVLSVGVGYWLVCRWRRPKLE